MDLYLTFGAPGIELDDLSGRLYAGTQRIPIPGGALLEDLGGGEVYQLTLAADAPGTGYTFTYEYPAGVAFTETWGVPSGGSPPCVIIAYREAGLMLGALGAELRLEGVSYSNRLRFLPLGTLSEPGDYALYGWPSSPGRWLLSWSLGEILFKREWGATPTEAGDRIKLDDRALSAFAVLWRAQPPPAPLASMPAVVVPGGGFRPVNQEPYAELAVLVDRGDESGPVGMKTYDLPGLVQVSIYVKDGDGRLLTTVLASLAAKCLAEMAVPGLRLYGGRKPYELPSPPEGYYGRGIDAPCRYVGP